MYRFPSNLNSSHVPPEERTPRYQHETAWLMVPDQYQTAGFQLATYSLEDNSNSQPRTQQLPDHPRSCLPPRTWGTTLKRFVPPRLRRERHSGFVRDWFWELTLHQSPGFEAQHLPMYVSSRYSTAAVVCDSHFRIILLAKTVNIYSNWPFYILGHIKKRSCIYHNIMMEEWCSIARKSRLCRTVPLIGRNFENRIADPRRISDRHWRSPFFPLSRNPRPRESHYWQRSTSRIYELYGTRLLPGRTLKYF